MLPFNKEQMLEIIKNHKTPFHIYDEKAMIENAQKLYKAFDWAPGFKNYFAVKALPNPKILEVLKAEGMGGDCSSLPELLLCEKVGITGENIMFTSNDTPADEYKKAFELGAVINFDDISHIDFFEQEVGELPKLVSFRYNPGPLKEGNDIIGNPVEAKYGLTRDQIFDAYKLCKEKGVKRFMLHTMVVSNMLDEHYLIDTAKMLFELVKEIKDKLDIKIEGVNLGGGFGIPYKPEEKSVDVQKVSDGIKAHYDEIIEKNDLAPLNIVMESGRMITGPYGYLITSVRHMKHTYKDYVGTDACMANLMRPGMYGAYHHITVLGKEDTALTETYDVTGSLCENNDKFAIDRKLPIIDVGDIIVIHNTGAHGHAMGFNYNGKLRSAELLLKADGSVELIRRAETVQDHFATLNVE